MPDSEPTPAEAPEADVLEQRANVAPDHVRPAPRLASSDPEVSEADLIEQSLDVPIDDDEGR